MKPKRHLGIRPQLNTNVSTHEKSQATCKKRKSKKLKGDQYRPIKESVVKSGNPKTYISNFSPPQLKAFARIIICTGVSLAIMIFSLDLLGYFIGLIR